MKPFQVFFCLSASIFFIVFGLFGAWLPWQENVLETLSLFIAGNQLALSLFSLLLFLLGGSALISLTKSLVARVFVVKQNSRSLTTIDEKIFAEYLASYLKHSFPDQTINSQAVLHKNRLTLSATLPPTSKSEQKELAKKMTKDLKEIFSSLLNYDADFALYLTFNKD